MSTEAQEAPQRLARSLLTGRHLSLEESKHKSTGAWYLFRVHKIYT